MQMHQQIGGLSISANDLAKHDFMNQMRNKR